MFYYNSRSCINARCRPPYWICLKPLREAIFGYILIFVALGYKLGPKLMSGTLPFLSMWKIAACDVTYAPHWPVYVTELPVCQTLCFCVWFCCFVLTGERFGFSPFPCRVTDFTSFAFCCDMLRKASRWLGWTNKTLVLTSVLFSLKYLYWSVNATDFIKYYASDWCNHHVVLSDGPLSWRDLESSPSDSWAQF